ncbi:hypothetical protein PpBr36_07964 [Pyricularia pennisetigena]|uniref:hypothetical protein n=1 Tax=Pyricularia pennisetigena TaxID=1578925 RepID=UPI0011544DDB|nr:hypothetical protein PpBr36_07964 [Pyricularia pennisetigena]TLS25679.1 hypothetical protein PpBr36_07964 [Pyricularia pennisetigena]
MSAYGDFYLIYWPTIPGRAEHIRLALELVGATYSDSAHQENGMDFIFSLMRNENNKLVAGVDCSTCPPYYAPPALRHGDLLLSQTPNILMYLAEQFPAQLMPQGCNKWVVNGLVLTALDGLSNEPHDCHHPISSGLYYEDQKTEALRKSREYVKARLPLFLDYFQRVLDSESSGDGPWLHGGRLTCADLVLFQCLDGVMFMFPRAMAKFKDSGKHDGLWRLYEAVRETGPIKKYLGSGKRQKYSNGIYRYYEDLDLVE